MEQTVQATVVDVSSRDMKRKADNAHFTLYDVKLSDGRTYTTSRRETAEAAHSLTGQLALVVIDEKVNGQYTNLYINDIKSTNGAMLPFSPSETAPTFPTPTAVAFGNTPAPIPDKSAELDAKIHRQVAAKVSAALSTNSVEFWANLEHLVRYFETGQTPDMYATAAADDGIPF